MGMGKVMVNVVMERIWGGDGDGVELGGVVLVGGRGSVMVRVMVG